MKNLTRNLDKFGIFGLFLTALFSPCCFPLFAFAGSALGLGTFEHFGELGIWMFQSLVFVTIAGLYLSYRNHRCKYPLIVALACGILIFYAFYAEHTNYETEFLYLGMFGMLIATLWNFKRNKMHRACLSCEPSQNKEFNLSSTITCPNCDHKKTETMPTNACTYFYECTHCKTRLKPFKGDCCVFCSYGTIKCPPIQAGEKCC